MCKVKLGLSALLFNLVISLSPAIAQPLSIGSIALGSSIDDASKSLKAKGLKVAPIKIQPSPEAASLEPQQLVVASVNVEAKSIDFWLVQAFSQRVFYVRRDVVFGPNKELNTQKTIDDLKGKFGGKMTYFGESNAGISSISHQFTLTWDHNGRGEVTPQRGPGSLVTCSPGDGSWGPNPPILPGIQLLASPIAFRPWLPHDTCTTGVYANLFTEAKDRMLLSRITLSIVDRSAIDSYERKLYEAVKARQDAIHTQANGRKTPL